MLNRHIFHRISTNFKIKMAENFVDEFVIRNVQIKIAFRKSKFIHGISRMISKFQNFQKSTHFR